jgi:hypothetical protein
MVGAFCLLVFPMVANQALEHAATFELLIRAGSVRGICTMAINSLSDTQRKVWVFL